MRKRYETWYNEPYTSGGSPSHRDRRNDARSPRFIAREFVISLVSVSMVLYRLTNSG